MSKLVFVNAVLAVAVALVLLLTTLSYRTRAHAVAQQNRQLQQQIELKENGMTEFRNSVIKTKRVTHRHLERRISFPELTAVQGDGALYSGHEGYTLLLVLSEMSCNVCQDEETHFANQLAEEMGDRARIAAVVHANSARYVRNYVRLNQVKFEVYLSENNQFALENGIVNSPLLLLLDQQNRVVAAHYPLPGEPELSEAFHQTCRELFAQPSTAGALAVR
jgi:hypothetical protein